MAASPTISPLTAHLGYWLRFVSNHVSHAFARKLEGQGITVAEWAILRELYGEEATSPSRLAERMGLTRGAISKLAERLIRKTLIVREASEQDGRAHSLALSAEGMALVPALAALADENDAAFFGDLAPQDRATLERVLKSIVRAHDLKSMPIA